jgi:hypothetical protein
MYEKKDLFRKEREERSGKMPRPFFNIEIL